MTPISISDMPARWVAANAPWGRGGTVRRAGADLLARYGEAHRHYHTAEHLAEVLTLLAGAPPEVELAAWFHDAVYDARAMPGVNERASAELAVAVLSAIGEVARLIDLTAGHVAAPGDVHGRALVDADLWILRSPASRYRRYAADVRLEYAFLSDAEWRDGRSRVLGRFLADPHLPVAARANLRWELAALGGGAAQP
jgi:predicted metal-dependent HD superfamily phosphohydrolase